MAVKGTPLRVAHYAEADLFAVLASRQVGSAFSIQCSAWQKLL